MPLKGQWGLVLVYFMGWFLNIFGEELWFRGYILLQQELAFKNIAWLVKGLMFTHNHLWQPWIMISILLVSLLHAWALQLQSGEIPVQKRYQSMEVMDTVDKITPRYGAVWTLHHHKFMGAVASGPIESLGWWFEFPGCGNHKPLC